MIITRTEKDYRVKKMTWGEGEEKRSNETYYAWIKKTTYRFFGIPVFTNKQIIHKL